MSRHNPLFKKLNSSEGISILEVLGIIAITGITMGLLLTLTLQNRSNKAQINKLSVFKEALLNNVVELRTKDLTKLPDIDKCLIRLYRGDGQFLSERIESIVNNKCPEGDISGNDFEVSWLPRDSSHMQVTFNNSSMQLPELNQNLREYTLAVRGYTTGTGSKLYERSVKIYKK